MAEIDPRDRVLQLHTPAVMVPRFGPLPDMERHGHRYLVAADGLWLEAKRAWLHARVHASSSALALPFGAITPLMWFAFTDEDLQHLVLRFLLDARTALPNEFAAWGVYEDGALQYTPLLATEASAGGITFLRPALAPEQQLAVDLHSHGTLPEFFSGSNDADDAGEIKLAVVAGTLDREPTFATRLCLLGMFIDGDEK